MMLIMNLKGFEITAEVINYELSKGIGDLLSSEALVVWNKVFDRGKCIKESGNKIFKLGTSAMRCY